MQAPKDTGRDIRQQTNREANRIAVEKDLQQLLGGHPGKRLAGDTNGKLQPKTGTIQFL
jgi:hypothetical protein